MNKELIAKIIRHALGFLGGYLAAKGIEITGTDMDAIAGGLAAVAAVAWSVKSGLKKDNPAPTPGQD